MVSELGLTDLIFENDGDGDQSVGPKRGFLKAGIRWKRTVPQSRCGLESFFDSFVRAIRYVLLRTRNADRAGAECAVCAFHLGDSSAHAGDWLESVAS